MTPLWDDGDARQIGGTQYNGFKVTFGGLQGEVDRHYEDAGADKTNFKTVEEHNASGTFKSFSVET